MVDRRSRLFKGYISNPELENKLMEEINQDTNNYDLNLIESLEEPKEIISEHCNFDIDMGIFTK